MVCRVKAARRDIAEAPGRSAPVSGTQGVAVVLDQPEVVRFGEPCDGIDIKRISEGVGDHNRPSFVPESLVKHAHVDVVSREFDINKHRDEPVLNYRVEGGGKTGCDSYYFIAWPQRPVTQFVRSKR